MPTFVRLGENLEILFSYVRETIKKDGDIEIPQEYYIDAITFSRDEDGSIVITRDTQKENELLTKSFKKLREQRNTRIAQTDYLATIDYPHPTPEIKQAWLDYRQ
jgi:hypothetical protein